jgi:hypothetical protein
MNKEGLIFEFVEPTASMVKRVKRYLEDHLSSSDVIFCFPYEFRYNLLLSKVTPGQVGPELWSGTAMPTERQRLIEELERIKPLYAVYDESEWPDTDGVAWMDRLPEIVDYLFAHYCVETRIDSTLILRRCAQIPRPPEELVTGTPENQVYLHRGWYHAELQGNEGGRWMSTTSTALLSRGLVDNSVTLTALSPGSDYRQLSVLINGTLLAKLPLKPGWQTYDVIIPPSMPYTLVNRVEFDIDRPLDVPDLRRLGIWVKSFGFRQMTASSLALPTLASVAQRTDSGDFKLYQLDFRKEPVAADIEWVQTIFNVNLTGVQACYLNYDVWTRSLRLADDSGISWNLAQVIGTKGVSQQNSQCAVNVERSSAKISGDHLILTLSVRNNPRTEKLNLYAMMQDRAGHRTDWVRTDLEK